MIDILLANIEFASSPKMFSILQKPQDTVNAEDLEILQNEIERCLVDVVKQKWDLERELLALNSTSPDINNLPSIAGATNITTTSAQSNTNHLSGKLRNSYRLNQIDASENSSDGFKSSLFGSSNNGVGGIASTTNSTEDSVSSEGSIASSLTSSTIITNTLPDLGSQIQTTNSTGTSSNKRSHKGTNERPSKRFRQNSSNSFTSTGIYTKRPHSKHRSKIVPSKFRNSLEESRPSKKQNPRNEAPDKLWPFVEQFCATPTEEQIKELEEMIKDMDNDKDYFKVPALGKKESANKDSPTKLDSTSTKNQRKSKSRNGDEEASLGALTQRLVSSLIEEMDETGTDVPKSGSDGSQSAKKKNSKSKIGSKSNIEINNAKSLEKRIRQELEEHEILSQQDDIPYTSEDDEILRELIASQHELLAIQRQNKDSMQRLLRKAKRHLELESEREQLREANADVIAAYHRLIQAKQRKRNPTKREKDVAWKALKVQEAIFKKCDDLYLNSLSRGSV